MELIKVLIVDDSALVRKILTEGLKSYSDIEIIGVANNPYVARDILVKKRPDVIILDIEMPQMDGLTFLKKFMQVLPTPTIILSALTQKGKKITVEAMESGAIEVMAKPQLGMVDNLPLLVKDLAENIRKACKVNIARYYQKNRKDLNSDISTVQTAKALDESTDQVIAIGASTGGVEALAKILPLFPAASPGMIIVEHMPAGFTKSFADRLNSLSQMQVKEAENDDRIRPGKVLIAPGGKLHTIVVRSGGEYLVKLVESKPVNGHCPSIDVLFDSIATNVAKNSIAVLMTGMGSDGAKGLLKIRLSGGKTMVQDKQSCVVFGMPDAALKIGASTLEVPLLSIPKKVIQLL